MSSKIVLLKNYVIIEVMKMALRILIIVSFIGIAVFGFAVMNHNGEHGGAMGCIAAAVKGTNCENGANAVSLALFHLEVFKDFSKAVLGGSFVAALLMVFAFMFLSRVWRLKKDFFALIFLSARFKSEKYLELFFPFSKKKFNRWLSLHENSPSIYLNGGAKFLSA